MNLLNLDLALHLRLSGPYFRPWFTGLLEGARHSTRADRAERLDYLEDFARHHGHADLLSTTVTSEEDTCQR